MLADIFLQSVLKRFREYKTLGEKTFAQLEENEMLFAPNEASNSIALIIQHMHGNMMSRWTNFLTEDGEKEWRRRDEEFETRPATKKELLELWNEGWANLFPLWINWKALTLPAPLPSAASPSTWWMPSTASWHITVIMSVRSFMSGAGYATEIGLHFPYQKADQVHTMSN